MKNKYEEFLDRIEIKGNSVDSIRQAVIGYEEKSNTKFKKIKLVSLMCVLLLIVSLLNFKVNHDNNKNSFVITADDNAYEVKKGKIILNDMSLKNYRGSLDINSNEYSIETSVALPLGIYVEGNNIDSIKYRLNSGCFIQYVERYDNRSRSKGSTGIYTYKTDEFINSMMREGFDIQGDPSKTQWDHYKKGKEITIPFEAQKTVNALYGVNVKVVDENLVKKLLATEKIVLERNRNEPREKYEKMTREIWEEIENKLCESLNQLEIEVLINYKDGTYEKTKLTLLVDMDNYKAYFSKNMYK